VLRRNKETLLTLLEAFVYDPLVDWTTNKAAFEEKMMELSVTLSLFCSRVDEMKTVTKDAHDNFASRFPSLVGALASMENTRKKLIDMKKNTSEKHQKLGTVKESLSKTIAALSKSTTFDGRIVKEKQLAEERDNMEKKIAATVKQLASTREAHFRSLALLKEPLALINEVKLSLTVPRTLVQVSSIDLPMREDILRRCGEVDLEMSRLITHREMLAVQCIELMNTYKSITSQLPTSYLGNTSLREWETLLNLLLAEPTPETMLKIEQYMDEASWKQAADRDRAIEKHLFQQVTALSQKWVNASSLVTPTIAKAEKFDLQTKQLRDQLLMMTSSINAQSGSTNASRFVQSLCLMLLADVSERVNGIQSLDVNAPPPNASGSWLWNMLSDLLDKSTFVGTIVRDSWADDPIKAAEIHADIIFSLEETIAPSVNTLLTNFTNLLLPQLVTIVQSNDQTVQDVLKNIARMAEQVKKFPSQDVSKIKPQSLDDETFGSLDPKDDEEEEDIVWDMPTKPASSKTGSSFFDLPEGNVKQEYDALVRSVPGAQLNAGKLLVSTFDALFQTLEKQHFELMDNCNEELTEFSVQQPLESVFFDQKLMTINSVLTTATELNGAPSTSTFTAKMTEHMGQFINAYAHKLFAPIVRALVLRFVNVRMPIKVDTTAVSEQLLKTSLLTWIQTNSVTVPYADQLTKILSDVTNCRDAWRLAATEKTTLLTEVPKLEAELNKTRLEYAQFTWMHEESLKYESADVSSQALMRSKLLENLATNVQAIQNIDKAIRECNKSHSDLETEVLKAMQWHYSQFTPKGKQVNDHPTVKTFQEAIQLRRQMVTLLFDKVKNVSDLCMAIVDLETSRAPPKSKSPLASNVAHQNYFQLAQQYFQSAHSLHQLRTEIDDTKKNTEQLTKDHKELSKASAELNSEVANLSAVIGDYQQKYNSNKGIVKNSLNHVQNAFEGYTQFSNEVESLLSNIVNITDEKWESVAQMHALAKKLQRNLKSLVTDLETFTKMASDFLALSDNDNKADVDTQKSVDNIRSRADKLVALENKIGQQVNELVAQSTEWQAQQSDGPLTQNSQEVSVDEADQSDKPRALMKNSTALSILKRVRDKLEGRDKSGDKKWTIPEQVEWTIHEATSLDNLAQLYEGWTAWI
jgi:PI-3-kinase-related kinase SMG-1